MLRRNPAATVSSRSSKSSALPQYALGHSQQKRKKAPVKVSGDVVVAVLVSAAILLLLATYSIPVGKELKANLHKGSAVEPRPAGQQKPLLANNINDSPGIVSNSLFHQPSAKSKITGTTWVEGEQKLKAALKELAERQARGLDIGVPVLTRWLGDDVPAWPSAQMPQEQWQQKVDEKYAAMRQEEQEWIQKMNAHLKLSPTRG